MDGVWQEDDGDDGSGNVESRSRPEAFGRWQIVEPDRGPQGATLGEACRDTMCSRPDWGWVQLACTPELTLYGRID